MAVTLAEVKALVSVPADTITDEQLTEVIVGHTRVGAAAAAICRRIASFYASRTDVGASGANVRGSQAYHHWLGLAREFEQRVSSALPPPVASGLDPNTAFDPDYFYNPGTPNNDDDAR